MSKKQEPAVATSEQYRQRAAEMRDLAEKAKTPDGRQAYLKLAAQWERLARRVEEPDG
ncbi:MAG: hypothetical protein JF627_06760 [Alphaproteobacteria bacterium]|nr:hypothetical protein [Alphaproteobacteria bacterium]